MSRRFFTSDWHLGFEKLLGIEQRPFKTIQEHDSALVNAACAMTSKDDIIYHLGDLACFGQDSHVQSDGLSISPTELVSTIPATFLNIHGNHDVNNKVKSVCKAMQIHLSRKFPDVICGHFPSYDARAKSYVKPGWIVLCGHVHKKWKHCLDLDNSCLNINVGVDVWDYKMASEEEVIKYIESVLRLPKDKINKVKSMKGKLQHV